MGKDKKTFHSTVKSGPKLHLLARKEARIAELAKIFFFANVVVRNEIAKPRLTSHSLQQSKIVVTTGNKAL